MRYLPHTGEDRTAMLARIGVSDIESLFADIPAAKRLPGLLDLPASKSEPPAPPSPLAEDVAEAPPPAPLATELVKTAPLDELVAEQAAMTPRGGAASKIEIKARRRIVSSLRSPRSPTWERWPQGARPRVRRQRRRNGIARNANNPASWRHA